MFDTTRTPVTDEVFEEFERLSQHRNNATSVHSRSSSATGVNRAISTTRGGSAGAPYRTTINANGREPPPVGTYNVTSPLSARSGSSAGGAQQHQHHAAARRSSSIPNINYLPNQRNFEVGRTGLPDDEFYHQQHNDDNNAAAAAAAAVFSQQPDPRYAAFRGDDLRPSMKYNATTSEEIRRSIGGAGADQNLAPVRPMNAHSIHSRVFSPGGGASSPDYRSRFVADYVAQQQQRLATLERSGSRGSGIGTTMASPPPKMPPTQQQHRTHDFAPRGMLPPEYANSLRRQTVQQQRSASRSHSQQQQQEMYYARQQQQQRDSFYNRGQSTASGGMSPTAAMGARSAAAAPSMHQDGGFMTHRTVKTFTPDPANTLYEIVTLMARARQLPAPTPIPDHIVQAWVNHGATGKYFVRYAKGDSPHERFFRMRVCESDIWKRQPMLEWYTHDRAYSVKGRVHLAQLVHVGVGVEGDPNFDRFVISNGPDGVALKGPIVDAKNVIVPGEYTFSLSFLTPEPLILSLLTLDELTARCWVLIFDFLLTVNRGTAEGMGSETVAKDAFRMNGVNAEASYVPPPPAGSGHYPGEEEQGEDDLGPEGEGF